MGRRDVSEALAVITQKFKELGASLPVMLHIWRDASDMDVVLARRVRDTNTRTLAEVLQIGILLEAWLRSGVAEETVLRSLLGKVPGLAQGLREVAALAGERYRRGVSSRKVKRRPVEDAGVVMEDALVVLAEYCELQEVLVRIEASGATPADVDLDRLDDVAEANRLELGVWVRHVSRWEKEGPAKETCLMLTTIRRVAQGCDEALRDIDRRIGLLRERSPAAEAFIVLREEVEDADGQAKGSRDLN